MTSLLACRLSCQGTTTVQSVAKGMITKKITSVTTCVMLAVKCTSKVSISGLSVRTVIDSSGGNSVLTFISESRQKAILLVNPFIDAPTVGKL